MFLRCDERLGLCYRVTLGCRTRRRRNSPFLSSFCNANESSRVGCRASTQDTDVIVTMFIKRIGDLLRICSEAWAPPRTENSEPPWLPGWTNVPTNSHHAQTSDQVIHGLWTLADVCLVAALVVQSCMGTCESLRPAWSHEAKGGVDVPVSGEKRLSPPHCGAASISLANFSPI